MLDFSAAGTYHAETGERVQMARARRPERQMGIAYVMAPEGTSRPKVSHLARQEMTRRFRTDHEVVRVVPSTFGPVRYGHQWWTVFLQALNKPHLLTGVVALAEVNVSHTKDVVQTMAALDESPLSLLSELGERIPTTRVLPVSLRHGHSVATAGVQASGGIVDDSHETYPGFGLTRPLRVVWKRGIVHQSHCGLASTDEQQVWSVCNRLHHDQVMGVVAMLGLTTCARCLPLSRSTRVATVA